jgi:hypothetical protein
LIGKKIIPTSEIKDYYPDYVLRCIKGYFKGRYIYLNLTPDGEVIGSEKSSAVTL